MTRVARTPVTVRRVARRWMTAAALLAALGVARAGVADVLDQVPSDALIVAKVKNLQGVSDKAGALAKQWGLVEMNPAAADPLKFLLEQGHVQKGIDKGGDLALVVVNGNLDGDAPPLIMLIPVTDYKEFIGNFADVKNDGGLDHFKWKVGDEPDNDETYAASWGKYAAITDAKTKDLLTKKPGGFKPSPAVARELGSKDVVAVVNFKVLGPKLNDQLKGKREEILGEVQKNLGADESKAKYVPLVKAVVSQGLNVATEFLQDAQNASFSVNLTKDGVATSLMADFAPDTYLGKNIAQVKGTNESLLVGLPEAKYLFFGGGVVTSDAGKKIFEDTLAPIEVELGKAGDNLKPVVAMVDGIKKMIAAEKAQASGLIAPNGALGATALIQAVTVTTGDAKVLMQGTQDMLQAQQQLMAMMPNQPQGGMKVDFKPDAKTVDGVSFTQFTTSLTNENTPEAAQVKQMLAIMYGPQGATGFMGAVDDQHLLTVAGLDDAMTSAAIKAVKEKADPLGKNEQLALVNKNLPQQRSGAFYIALGDLVTTGTNYAKMMGMPIPVNIQPNLPPVGVAIATEGPALRIDSFIPADLVEQMIATGLQLKMMNQGGGKPGGL